MLALHPPLRGQRTPPRKTPRRWLPFVADALMKAKFILVLTTCSGVAAAHASGSDLATSVASLRANLKQVHAHVLEEFVYYPAAVQYYHRQFDLAPTRR